MTKNEEKWIKMAPGAIASYVLVLAMHIYVEMTIGARATDEDL
jgi:hypothetical protein